MLIYIAAAMASAVFPSRLVVALLLVTLSALPISRLFQWRNPPPAAIALGGYSAVISLPIVIKIIMFNEEKTTLLTKLAMCEYNVLSLFCFMTII